MAKMQMDVGEIRRSYNTAKDKKAQIRILADLNQCSRRDIERIVFTDEGNEPSVLDGYTHLPVKRRSHIKDSETIEKIVQEYLAGGITLSEVGDMYGISASTVAKFVKQYKASKAEVEPATGTSLAAPLAAVAETSTKAGSALDDLFNAVIAMVERVERECAEYENICISKTKNGTQWIIEKDGIRINMEKINPKEETK